MINVLFAAQNERWIEYEAPLREALDTLGVPYTLATDIPADQVDFIVYAPNSDLQDFTPYTRAQAVLNLWAGVESIAPNPTLNLPLARMVDQEGLTQGMIEWVTGHVLRHHLGMDAHIQGQDGIWRAGIVPPIASERRVCILGLGALGMACAEMLVKIGFDVCGWSKSQKTAEFEMYHGDAGLAKALDKAEIVVLLLPATTETENILNTDRFAQMAKGAVIINPGRGPLIDDDALLAALESGQLGHATLDVFRIEPLPQDHPFWAHPKITVTPHIASETRAPSASRAIVANIKRALAGEPLLHLVDRQAGY
jgi:glyoxylate/hydroxypyruvate reductase A